jgi:hypothetical protein
MPMLVFWNAQCEDDFQRRDEYIENLKDSPKNKRTEFHNEPKIKLIDIIVCYKKCTLVKLLSVKCRWSTIPILKHEVHRLLTHFEPWSIAVDSVMTLEQLALEDLRRVNLNLFQEVIRSAQNVKLMCKLDQRFCYCTIKNTAWNAILYINPYYILF